MRRRRKGNLDPSLTGVLLVDKPAGPTSHDICQQVRGGLRLEKVGHGGTLDPFATGLLPLLLNGATRLMPYLQAQDKSYEAVARLGARTDTQDPTGQIVERRGVSGFDAAQLDVVAARFLGPQKQRVPKYAAARVDGRHLYEYARAGEEVQAPEKDVHIHELRLWDPQPVPGEDAIDVRLFVRCSAGTYVRALAEDIGAALGTGGYLASLRRTAIGALGVDQALTVDRIEELVREDRSTPGDGPWVPAEHRQRWIGWLGAALRAPEAALSALPRFVVAAETAERVLQGRPIRKPDVADRLVGAADFQPGDRLLLLAEPGAQALALVKALVARDVVARRESAAIIFEIERVLR